VALPAIRLPLSVPSGPEGDGGAVGAVLAVAVVAAAVGLAVPLLQAPAPNVTALSSTAAPSALDVLFVLLVPQ